MCVVKTKFFPRSINIALLVTFLFTLRQWFPTGVPRHTRVPWTSARGDANFYLSLIFIPIKLTRVPPNTVNTKKGCSDQKKVGKNCIKGSSINDVMSRVNKTKLKDTVVNLSSQKLHLKVFKNILILKFSVIFKFFKYYWWCKKLMLIVSEIPNSG